MISLKHIPLPTEFQEDDNDVYYMQDVFLDDDNPIKITSKKPDVAVPRRTSDGPCLLTQGFVTDSPLSRTCSYNKFTGIKSSVALYPKKPRPPRIRHESVISFSGECHKKGLGLKNLSSKIKKERLRPHHGQVSIKRRNNNSPEPESELGLPVEFKNLIRELVVAGKRKVSDAKLVIQKQLMDSDVKKNQNRLSIPMKHIKEEFVTDEEYRLLCQHDGKKVGSIDDVPLITPTMDVAKVSLRRWEMRKANGPPSVSYVLTKTWNEIRAQMKLRSGMIVQLWAFRVDGELVFALSRLA